MSSSVADIETQAGEWLLELQRPDISVERIAAWQQWLSQSTRHARAFDELQRLSTFLDRELADKPRSQLPWPTPREVAADGRPRRLRRFMAIAATGLIAVIGILWLTRDSDALILETLVREHQNVRLSDGSIVSVGAASRLRVSMLPQSRIIELERGEAYFQVAKDPKRPFRVRSGATSVTALGTAFNVRRAGDRVVVGVSEGVVAVAARGNTLLAWAGMDEGGELRLDAGKRLVIEPTLEAPPEVETVAPTTIGSWRSGRLHYAGEPLSVVIDDLNRHLAAPVVIADSSISGLRVTGTVSEENILSWLQSLQSALPIEVVSTGDSLELRALKAARP